MSPFAQTIGRDGPSPQVAQSTGAPGPPCDFPKSVPTVSASVFEVVTDHWRGSAFYIGNDEFLTDAHVIADATRIRLRGNGQNSAATLVGLDSKVDVALLRASGAGLLRSPSPASRASVQVTRSPSPVTPLGSQGRRR